MNRYNESPTQALRFLNAKPEYNGDTSQYKIELYAPELIDSACLYEAVWRGNPMSKNLCVGYAKDSNDSYTWSNFSPMDIISIDSQDGKIVYVNSDSTKLVLTRVKTQMIDFKDLLV